MPLILYTGMKQNAPERPQDALKRKPHFQGHSGRENPLAEYTPQAVYLTFWGVFACAIECLFMYDHRKPLGHVWEGLKENRLQALVTCKRFQFVLFILFSIQVVLA